MQSLTDFCEEGIFGTYVTLGDVQEKCLELFGDNAKFGPNKSMKSIGDGRGFMSKMVLFTADWNETAPEAPKEFLIKITSTRQMAEMQETMKKHDITSEDFFPEAMKLMMEDIIRGIHNNECTVYELFEETAVKNIFQPKIYYSSNFTPENRLKGFILMEYIPNSVPLNVYNNITAEQLEQPLRAIARLQASSVHWTEEQRARISMNPFDGIYQQVLSKETVDKFQMAFHKFGGERMKERADKIDAIIDDLIDFKYFRTVDSNLGMKSVFAHGDLWSTNIIWTRESPEAELKTGAIVDYQTSHIGNACIDLVRATCACLSGDERRSKWEWLLESFYDELRATLNDKDLPYSLEQLKECYRQLFPLGGFCIFPMIGPIFQMYSANPDVEAKEQVMDLIMEKTEALIDDVLFYNQRNREIREKEADAEEKQSGTV